MERGGLILQCGDQLKAELAPRLRCCPAADASAHSNAVPLECWSGSAESYRLGGATNSPIGVDVAQQQAPSYYHVSNATSSSFDRSTRSTLVPVGRENRMSGAEKRHVGFSLG